MILEVRVPSHPLDRFIEYILFYDDYSPEHTMERLLPDGAVHLVIDMEDRPKKLFDNEDLSRHREFKGGWIAGQHRGYIHIDALGVSKMVVRFRPGGAYPFLNMPLSELNDSVIQHDLIWGRTIGEMRERILEQPTIDGKFGVAELYMRRIAASRLQENRLLQAALDRVMSEPHLVTTKNLANDLGISQKHLISLFDKHVGLTPKLLARIYRFQKALIQIEGLQGIDWLSIAYDCGYYDQSHFIKDFQAFSGINPSAYLTVKGEYLNYLVMEPEG